MIQNLNAINKLAVFSNNYEWQIVYGIYYVANYIWDEHSISRESIKGYAIRNTSFARTTNNKRAGKRFRL